MRKLVFGIALVICLDVAFIFLTATETEVPELAHAIAPRIPEPVTPYSPRREPVAVIDTEAVDDGATGPSAGFRPRGSRSRSDSSTTRTRSSGAKKNPNPARATKRLFPDKVIHVGRPETYEPYDFPKQITSEKRSARSDRTAAAAPARSKGRSFEAKAFGVIKKPYKWIKSLASKIGP